MAYLPCFFVGGFNRSFKCEMWCRQLIVTQASCIIHMLSNEIGGNMCYECDSSWNEFSGGIFKNGKRCVLKQMREEKLF